jgi:hypothetical protein
MTDARQIPSFCMLTFALMVAGIGSIVNPVTSMFE